MRARSLLISLILPLVFGARAWGLWGSLALGLLAPACGDDQGPSGVDTTDGETTANTISASGSSSSTTGMLDGSSLGPGRHVHVARSCSSPSRRPMMEAFP